jgi:non-heme chloroperoxidase
VFLHGVTDSWRSFEHLLAGLPQSIRAFALTQRGHGDSSKPADGYRFADLVADVRAFMDAMAIERAAVVGHSMGASVAMRFAIDHPDRVTRLVLMGAFASLQSEAVQEFWDTGVSTLNDPIPRDFAHGFQVSTLAHPIDAGQLDTFVNESLKVPARVWRSLFKGFLETPDLGPELARITAPTLIVWGARDEYVPRAEQDVLQQAIPNARLLAYADAGHALHWEDPRRVAADLVAFLANSDLSVSDAQGTGDEGSMRKRGASSEA